MVRILCETKALRPSSLAIVHKSEVENLAGTIEDFCYLLFGKACDRKSQNKHSSRGEYGCSPTVRDVANEHNPGYWLRHIGGKDEDSRRDGGR